MASLIIEIRCEWEWLKETGDCSKCKSCKQIIYGNKYSLYLFMYIGTNADVKDTDVILCESCYDCFKKKTP